MATTTRDPDDREGLSPEPQRFALADMWEDDDDDMEYEPASERSDYSQLETDDDDESEYLGKKSTMTSDVRWEADKKQMPKPI